MSSTQENVYVQYGDGMREDSRSTSSRSSSLEFYYTKKHLKGFINMSDKVLEIGCATGHYGFYFADKCKEYLGVDLLLMHIDFFNNKIKELGITNLSCQVGDATNLKNIENESFDVVLCLGPMYHLPADEREIAFSECNRVCKKGGIAAFAYINKIGVYTGACIFSQHYPNAKTTEYVFEKETDDAKPGTFFFTIPEDIEKAAKEHGFKKIKNLGTDFFITMSIVDKMDDEKFELFKPLAEQMTSYESCTGMSNHALLICRKEDENG